MIPKSAGIIHFSVALKLGFAKTAVDSFGFVTQAMRYRTLTKNIDIKAKKPILANKFGGLSGKAIKPIWIKVVWDLYENFDVPIIGVGWIMTGEDAIEYMMAGASAVQIGSGVYYRGYDIFKKVCDEIIDFLKEENLTLEEIIGIAHE